MLCSNSEAAQCAKLLISGYPNSTITEPEYYISQLVSLFINFEKEVVVRAVSPSGIPSDISKFLPTIGEITVWLNKRAEYNERTNRYAALPLPEFRSTAIENANLFVPDSVDGYWDMVERAKKAPDKYHRYERNHVCVDGEIKDGIWIPSLWWEERRGKVRYSGLPLQVKSDLIVGNISTNADC